MINGIINVYKEKGFTSFDVCAVMRGISGQKKVGHTGTLDPDAEGVLPVLLGNATKLCDMLTDKRKEYVADFILGITTDTLDISGKVLDKKEPKVSEQELRAVSLSFIGGYNQIPPMYSSKKINGKKLVDLAREDKVVERKPVFVDIFDIEILEINYPNVKMRVECGKGTYIRSLIDDIGKKCGEYACMTNLVRTKVSEFSINDALKLSELTDLKNSGKLMEVVKGTDLCFPEYKKVYVKKNYRKLIDNGNKLFFDMVEADFDCCKEEFVRIYNDDKVFVGIFNVIPIEKVLKPFKMFIGE